MPESSDIPTPAIEFDSVNYTYPGAATPAVQGVSLRVDRGERLGILGPNGGGKSTLLGIMMGLTRGYTGAVRVLGVHPNQARRDGRIGAVLQKCEVERRMPISVSQAVELAATRGAGGWGRPTREVRERVRRSLALVGAEHIARRPIGALSGGQLQRVLIARALAVEPEILALDEPTVGVDVEGQARFADLIRNLHAELGLTIVIVSHDVRAVAAGCDRVACLARTLHYHDAPSGLTPQVLAEVFSHDMAGVFGDVHISAHAAADCPGDHADHETHSGHTRQAGDA